LQGLGIALVAANVSKLPVLLLDTNEAQLNKGMKFMGMSFMVSLSLSLSLSMNPTIVTTYYLSCQL
jgi:3-hydroxyacyl-CoA dehydrogenase